MIFETIVVRSTVHQLSFWTTAENQAELWEFFSHFNFFLDRQVETWGRRSVVVVVVLSLLLSANETGLTCVSKEPLCLWPFLLLFLRQILWLFPGKLSVMLCTLSLWQPSSSGYIWFSVYEAYLATFYWKLKPLETEPDRILIWTELILASRTGFEEQIILWTPLYNSKFLHFLKKCEFVWLCKNLQKSVLFLSNYWWTFTKNIQVTVLDKTKNGYND